MSCSISRDSIVDWAIQVKHIDELNKHLYDNKENGGEILIDQSTKTSSTVITTHAGKTDSVEAPDSILNWHSHPISCYKQEKTVWGWSSGEDMRESIIFGLRGSACHFIPSVEGLYTIQTNPCVITSLLNIDKLVNRKDYPGINIRNWDWGDFLRGFIILAVEIYFRSSHIFRTMEYMKKNKNIKPSDYIIFCNSFKLSNLFKKDQINGCGSIKCNRIHTFEKNKMNNVSFKNYTDNYESGKDTSIYLITKDGHNTVTNVKFVSILNSGGLEILKHIDLGNKCNIKIPKLHTSNIFQVSLYPNIIRYNGLEKKYIDMEFEERYDFIMNKPHAYGDIYLDRKANIKIRMFDISGNCNHTNLKKHIQGYGTIEDANRSVNEVSHEPRPVKTSKRKTSKRKTSKRKTSKRRLMGHSKRKIRFLRSKKITKSNKQTLTIIGSDDCKYCVIANDKANKMKNIHNFKYISDKYPSIKEAIMAARRITKNNEISTIPVYILNGEVVQDPYARF
jgi:hypothetical protein